MHDHLFYPGYHKFFGWHVRHLPTWHLSFCNACTKHAASSLHHWPSERRPRLAPGCATGSRNIQLAAVVCAYVCAIYASLSYGRCLSRPSICEASPKRTGSDQKAFTSAQLHRMSLVKLPNSVQGAADEIVVTWGSMTSCRVQHSGTLGLQPKSNISVYAAHRAVADIFAKDRVMELFCSPQGSTRRDVWRDGYRAVVHCGWLWSWTRPIFPRTSSMLCWHWLVWNSRIIWHDQGAAFYNIWDPGFYWQWHIFASLNSVVGIYNSLHSGSASSPRRCRLNISVAYLWMAYVLWFLLLLSVVDVFCDLNFWLSGFVACWCSHVQTWRLHKARCFEFRQNSTCSMITVPDIFLGRLSAAILCLRSVL